MAVTAGQVHKVLTRGESVVEWGWGEAERGLPHDAGAVREGIASEQTDTPRRRPQQTGTELHQCRLARAVQTDQGDNRTTRQCHGQITKRGAVTVPASQAVGFHDGRVVNGHGDGVAKRETVPGGCR